MSDKEYHVVDVDLTEAEELKPDVHLEVAGVKLDLPNLNNAELPIELVQAILLVKSKPALSDEETTACVSTFLAYFQTMQPNFWNVLRKTKRPMAYLTATIKAWAEESGTNLIWMSSNDFAVKYSVNKNADYGQAVADLLGQYTFEPVRPLGQLYQDPQTGQRTLVVR